ncbi:MAG TPA: transposase [Gemmatimonadaceae bacterium]|nr:transposase [Gemmatimonadaceae bacterium]
MEGTATGPRAPLHPALLDPLLRRASPARKRGARALLSGTLELALEAGLLPAAPEIIALAVDSTGFRSSTASAYYTWRGEGHRRPSGGRPSGIQSNAQPFDGGWRRRPSRRRWPKLSLASEISSHLIVGVEATWGPTQDAPHFLPLLSETLQRIPPTARARLAVVLADAAYDSEANRVGARALGIRRPVIALNPGPSRSRATLPRGRERRQAALHFPKRLYRRRAIIECVISRMKRRLGDAVRARRPDAQLRQLWCRAIMHNITLLWSDLRLLFNRARGAEERHSLLFVLRQDEQDSTSSAV